MHQLCVINYQMLQLNKQGIATNLFTGIMEFKQEELVEREIEIACYLFRDFSLNQMAEKTGLNKKILTGHLRNMMQKLQAADMDELIQFLKQKEL
jgi:DNA-binding NarL/FixJ family response regulator